MPYQADARKVLATFLRALGHRERAEFLLLAEKWGTVSVALEDSLAALAAREFLTRDQLYRSELYQAFLLQSRAKTYEFHRMAEGVIINAQRDFGVAGLECAQQMVGLRISFFQHLPETAINVFVGKSQAGAPLYELLAKSYPESVLKLTDTLLRGTALGWNPTKTAREMADDMHGNLDRALRVARTEQMNTFRDAERLQLDAAGIDEWEWLVTNDNTTCDECRSHNGERHPVGEPMDTHPNCRCAVVPVV